MFVCTKGELHMKSFNRREFLKYTAMGAGSL
ncbi:MAG: twin-arginine translocation signal domain-containing protein, partial [Caldilinea sp. CFX5]|nr:twin-arginine translocation signal domain-containing protein [Caldilinea sp. CFX5]